MTLTLSITSLRRHNACGLEEDKRRLDELRVAFPGVEEDTPVPLSTWWGLRSTSLNDRWWSLRAVEPLLEGRILGVRAACLAVRRALPVAEEAERPVCLAAVEAAEAWASEPTEECSDAAMRAAAKIPPQRGRSPAAGVRHGAKWAALAARSPGKGRDPFPFALDDAASWARYALLHFDDDDPTREHRNQVGDLDRLLAELDRQHTADPPEVP